MLTYYQMAMERERKELLQKLRDDYRFFIHSQYGQRFGSDDIFQRILETTIKDLGRMSFLEDDESKPHALRFQEIVALADKFLRLEETNIRDDITFSEFIDRFLQL